MRFWQLCMNWVLFTFSFLTIPSYADPQVTEDAMSALPPSHSANSLPEVFFGKPNPNARLEIIMYHSLACSHCKEFKEKILPIIKKKFIDTGYVRFILIDFPTDSSALDAAKVAWSDRDKESYLNISKLIVDAEEEWVGKADWSDRLCDIIEKHGLMTKDQCKKAMSNETLGKQILKTAFNAQEKYGIDYAPAFLLNGKLHKSLGLLSPADIRDELKKLGIDVQS